VSGGPPSAGAELTPAARLRAIVASSAGNLVEWYDFYVYSFTSLYFASAFFPSDDPTAQLLSAAAVFAVGFLMRPLGGWLFGRLADRRGRKTSLLLSVLIMCVGSLAIAVLPTHAAIGAAAPTLLLVVRMVQGLALGGEYGATATYMSEVSVCNVDRRAAGRAACAGAATAAAAGGRHPRVGLARAVRPRRRVGDRGALLAQHAP
jgi:MFS family permease